MKTNKGSAAIALLIAGLVVIALGGYYWSHRAPADSTEQVTATMPTPSPTPTSVKPTPAPSPKPAPTTASIPANWKTYTSVGGGFSLAYPSDWTAIEQTPGSIVFGKVGTSKQGTISAVVRTGTMITDESARFGNITYVFKNGQWYASGTAQIDTFVPGNNGPVAIPANVLKKTNSGLTILPGLAALKTVYVALSANKYLTINLPAGGPSDVEWTVVDQIAATVSVK